MEKLKRYTIPFSGLKEGKHLFEFNIDNTFFAFFEFEDFNATNVSVSLCLHKKSTMLELDFEVKGSVNVHCDLTNEPFDQPVDGKLFLAVKFGDAFQEVNEELLVLPHGEHEINVQQYIYEAIILSVPVKRTHPGIEDGTLKSDILEKLEELRPKTEQEKKNKEEIDPRWNKLKTLLKNK